MLERVNGQGFAILADGRAPLRLARDVGRTGKLSPAAIDRAMTALTDFKRLADGAGATKILAVATSAVRESTNRNELLRRVKRELGLRVRVITGDEEAELSFLGAIESAPPVRRGILFDLGGGSLEVTRFPRSEAAPDVDPPPG